MRKAFACFALALLIGAARLSAADSAAEGAAYAAVMRELSSHDQRLPGSAGYTASLDAIEKALAGAGLAVHRQTYDTLVPVTKVCRLTIDGHEVGPVLPLAPNGVAPATTWGSPATGPLLYVGDGSLEALDGKPIAGAIAVMEFGSTHLAEVFSQGARAVVFVGNDQANQWNIESHFTTLPVSLPRVWIDRPAAQAAGLLTADGSIQASLDLSVRWERVVATNLWAKIQGKAVEPVEQEAGAAVANPKALVLSANVDTFGAIPDLDPQLRWAANAALLAEVAGRLARTPLDRSVYVLFLGSHHAAQDGARHFYYVVNKAEHAKDTDSLAIREKDLCQDQVTRLGRRLALLESPGFVSGTDADSVELYLQAKRHLVGLVNNINFELRQCTLDELGYQREIKDLEKTELAAAGEAAAAATARLAEVRATLTSVLQRQAELNDKKTLWNQLRGQLAAKNITDAEGFSSILADLSQTSRASKAYFESLLRHTRSFLELEAAIKPAGTVDNPGIPEVIAAHFAFDFASSDETWMFSPFGADSCSRHKDVTPGTFSKQLRAYQEVYASLPKQQRAQLYTPDQSVTFRFDALCTPHQRSVPSTAAFSLGVSGFQLQTVGDPLDADEMPVRRDADLLALSPQLTAFITALAASPNLPSTDIPTADMTTQLVLTGADGKLTGLEVVDTAKGSDDVQGPSSDAIMYVGSFPNAMIGAEPRYIVGGCDFAMSAVDPTGHVFAPNVVQMSWGGTNGRVGAFGFDASGGIDRFTVIGSSGGSRASLHYGYGGGFFTPLLPLDYNIANIGHLLIARSDTESKNRFSAGFNHLEVFYQDQRAPFKYLGNGIDMFGTTPESPAGIGLPLDPRSMLSIDPSSVASHDLANLNLQRLKTLRSRNIINKPLEKLQADAEDHLDLAAEARAKNHSRLATAHETIADMLGHRVHQPLRDNANDLVQAVIILLLLCLPFAFAVERLVFGFTSIYRQIAGFLGVFLATFGILYETHPAFALAEAPIIIFLAFIIILLSAFVIHVVMAKFKHELRAMQGLSSKVHGGSAEGGTAFAAVAIGISGMRNRPLKTFLTATTVALLTFTILVFASFSSSLAVVETYLGAAHGDARIEFHTPSFLSIPYRLRDTIAVLFQDRYEMRERGASFRDPTMSEFHDDVVNIARNPRNQQMQALEAVLVVDPAEVPRLDPMFAPLAAQAAAQPDGNSVASTVGDPPLLLPRTVADKLTAAVGDVIVIRGQRFRVAGIFEGVKLKHIENIDGTRIVPPNFDATFAANGARSDGFNNLANTFRGLDVNNFIFSSADLVAVATFPGMGKLGSYTNLVTLYPKEGADVDADARELAEYIDGPVVATSASGSRRFFFTQAIEGSGFMEVLVPLLLGGLIIFSSLLGSIVDRQKEIFTFSALGLAPPDVGALFFAESAVFAVIGGMGGYLISQVVVKLLSVLSAFGLADVPDINFSSFSSIATILIVMATVMLSTIYPALMAGRSANPGVARKWKMPKPEGDVLRFTFPFTVSADSITGILAFIREHFENHGDASLGAFSARDISIVSEARPGGGRNMGITAEVALAPFDLGVFQRFTMTTQPSDIPGIDEVVVELKRLNGAPGTWMRGNRGFIDDLREQFLRWRSLPLDTVEHYHALAQRAVSADRDLALAKTGGSAHG